MDEEPVSEICWCGVKERVPARVMGDVVYCLLHNKGSLRAPVHGVAKSQTPLRN